MTNFAHYIEPDFKHGSIPVTRPTLSPNETTCVPLILDRADCLGRMRGGAGIALPANDAGAGPATILVVEDEELILAVTADFLRDCGFNILEATSTKQAKRVLASTAAIDILFSDIRLPDESGFELARWCQQTRPDVQILLTSGFYDVPADISRFSILPKPYTFRELMARMESLLPPRTEAPWLADVRAGEERPSSSLSRLQSTSVLVR